MRQTPDVYNVKRLALGSELKQWINALEAVRLGQAWCLLAAAWWYRPAVRLLVVGWWSLLEPEPG